MQTKVCQHCHEEIAELRIERHEKTCATATPAERQYRHQARLTSRRREEARKLAAAPTAPTPTKRQHVPAQLKGRQGGRRFSITLTLDSQALGTLLMRMGPSVSIDKIEVV